MLEPHGWVAEEDQARTGQQFSSRRHMPCPGARYSLSVFNTRYQFEFPTQNHRSKPPVSPHSTFSTPLVIQRHLPSLNRKLSCFVNLYYSLWFAQLAPPVCIFRTCFFGTAPRILCTTSPLPAASQQAPGAWFSGAHTTSTKGWVFPALARGQAAPPRAQAALSLPHPRAQSGAVRPRGKTW